MRTKAPEDAPGKAALKAQSNPKMPNEIYSFFVFIFIAPRLLFFDNFYSQYTQELSFVNNYFAHLKIYVQSVIFM